MGTIISPDLRHPCDNISSIMWLGGCNNFATTTSYSQSWNLTKTNRLGTTGPLWVDPYQRPLQSTAPDCSPYNNLGYTCGNGTNGNPKCEIPLPTEFSASNTSAKIKFLNGLYPNYYSGSNTTASKECSSYGFKNVYANAPWSGRFGYLSKEYGAPSGFDYCGEADYLESNATPDTTKYLSINSTANYSKVASVLTYDTNVSEYYCSNLGYNVQIACYDITSTDTTTLTSTATNNGHLDVDGNIHMDTYTSSSSNNDLDVANASLSNTLMGNYTIYDLWIRFKIMYADQMAVPDVITGTESTGWHMEWHSSYDYYNQCDEYVSTTTYNNTVLEVNLSSGHLLLQHYGVKYEDLSKCSNAIRDIWKIYEEKWTMADTTFRYLVNVEGADSVSVHDITHTSVTASIGTANTTSDVQTRLTNLLGYWDMGDDDVYKWRYDGHPQLGPLVTYDATIRDLQLPIESSSIDFTGNIIGKPLPAGYNNFWDAKHRNAKICNSLVNPECVIKYDESVGAWSDDVTHDGYVPSATQWINLDQMTQLPYGPFIGSNWWSTTPSSCNSIGPTQYRDDTLWACKWAEQYLDKPSINFARPYGLDRLQISSSTFNCISQSIGGVITTNEDLVGIATNDLVYVGGYITGSVTGSGLYKITKTGARKLALTTCIVSASWLPDVPEPYEGTGYIGRLKYQNPLKPALGGRYKITSVVNQSPITCSLDVGSDHYLFTGDPVTIVQATGSNINGNWSVVRFADGTICLTGSVSGSTPYTGGGQIYSTNAADYKWDDSDGKHQMTYYTWSLNYREVGEQVKLQTQADSMSTEVKCDYSTPAYYPAPGSPVRYNQSLHGMPSEVYQMTGSTVCVDYNPCYPPVVYFAPAGQDHFVNGTNLGWGDGRTTYLDHDYPSFWQAMVVQAIGDPFWQRPNCPCSLHENHFECNVNMKEDSGFCDIPEDGQIVYPHRPLVENMLDVPSGSPSLPTGVWLNYLTLGQLNTSGTPPQGNIITPPVNYGYLDYTKFSYDLPIQLPWSFVGSACNPLL